MLNQLVLVGRLVSDPQINETENNKKVCNLTLAVPRSYKNENGEYDTDFIPCVLLGNIASTTTEYCKKGDLIGIKGRVARLGNEELEIMVDKVTFLSNNPPKED